MDTIIGFLDSNGHPHFTIEVYGFNPNAPVKINAMMDTGFTGFLSLPLTNCFQAGLILLSTATYTLADGSPSNTLLCLGTIKTPTRNIVGAIAISFKSPDAIIGIDFLQKINGKLIFDMAAKTCKIEIPKILPTPTTTILTTRNLRGRPKKK